jgi:hypothetical protein
MAPKKMVWFRKEDQIYIHTSDLFFYLKNACNLFVRIHGSMPMLADIY